MKLEAKKFRHWIKSRIPRGEALAKERVLYASDFLLQQFKKSLLLTSLIVTFFSMVSFSNNIVEPEHASHKIVQIEESINSLSGTINVDIARGLGLHDLGVVARSVVERVDSPSDPIAIGVDAQIEPMATRRGVAKADHVAEFPCRIDVQQRERWRRRMERLQRQTKHHRGVLADRIQHDRAIAGCDHLAHDEDGFRL